jgi:hypothetical protein
MCKVSSVRMPDFGACFLASNIWIRADLPDRVWPAAASGSCQPKSLVTAAIRNQSIGSGYNTVPHDPPGAFGEIWQLLLRRRDIGGEYRPHHLIPFTQFYDLPGLQPLL